MSLYLEYVLLLASSDKQYLTSNLCSVLNLFLQVLRLLNDIQDR